MADLETAKAGVVEWWARKEPFVRNRGGFRVRQGLVEQMQREALAESHKVAALNKLSEADSNTLIAFALGTVKVPEW